MSTGAKRIYQTSATVPPKANANFGARVVIICLKTARGFGGPELDEQRFNSQEAPRARRQGNSPAMDFNVHGFEAQRFFADTRAT